MFLTILKWVQIKVKLITSTVVKIKIKYLVKKKSDEFRIPACSS